VTGEAVSEKSVVEKSVAEEGGAGGRAGGRWTSRRALIAHGVLVVWIPGCVAACWWQVTVALSGDSLGWVYSVMWPSFGVFGIVLWWHLVHDDPDTVGARGLERLRRESEKTETGTGQDEEQSPPDDAIARAEAEDPELAAYNAYLAELRRGPETKSWRRRESSRRRSESRREDVREGLEE
jgi:hypothetical protein